MGLTYVTVRVTDLVGGQPPEEVELVVDTGATLSVIPRPILARLGVAPLAKRQLRAFGGSAEREVGEVRVHYDGDSSPVRVIFGEEGDPALMGATTLEQLGYEVHPISHELKPTTMWLL